MAIHQSHANWLATLILVVAPVTVAADTHEHEHNTKQEAHVHGVAELTMALEDNVLEINLESPSANIVGFEHRASSQEQKSAVDEAERILGSPTSLFNFTGADCQVGRSIVDVSTVEGPHDGHDTEDHDDDHGDNHGHESEHDDGHSEISVNYQFTCEQDSELIAVSVDILDYFPAIEVLHVQWVTDAGQGATELSGNSKIVKLR